MKNVKIGNSKNSGKMRTKKITNRKLAKEGGENKD